MSAPDVPELIQRIRALEAECADLHAENRRLRNMPVAMPEIAEPGGTSEPSDMEAPIHARSVETEKIALFRRIFRGREDVYAVRWTGKTGKSGYSPAAVADWSQRDAQGKPARTLLALTDEAIRDHLTGKQTVGVYPLLLDEMCHFLAADFDKDGWQEDAAAFLETCRNWKVSVALERSRSGKGGHVWIFFASAVPATLARKLGAAILTRTMERRHQIGLDSYDRFFPNQDTMPKGGFGNLIALPLQHGPRQSGNSVFVDESLTPYPDQWAFLSTLPRVTFTQAETVIHDAEQHGGIIGLRLAMTGEDDDDSDPWLRPPSRRPAQNPISGPLPATVKVVRGNLIYVEKEGLPSAMLNRLLRLAAFQNPEFYKAQAMRLSTFGKPRVIRCGEEFPKHIGLPRGCFAEVLELLRANGIAPEVEDQRFTGLPLALNFLGELRPDQTGAVNTLLKHDDGVLSATTAFGKTVIAAKLISARGVNALVLVHRRQLLDQWRERLAMFLDIAPGDIGHLSGGKDKLTRKVDIAVIQSLNRQGTVLDCVANYGHIIVDECHHLSAFSFEQVLRQVKARYLLGLTATPIRKDGHHPIIFMQCGPIRLRVDALKQAALRPFTHWVVPRPTLFQLPPAAEPVPIQQLYQLLADNPRRNAIIVADTLATVAEGRSPLILTERRGHAEHLAAQLTDKVPHIVLLTGGASAKQRAASAAQLTAIQDGEPRVLIATGRYIGEGFDDARLDTLLLALPISWRGTLQQYVGRLHRLHASKKEVRVLDYVDDAVPMLARMYEKRIRGYEAVGYQIRDGEGLGI